MPISGFQFDMCHVFSVQQWNVKLHVESFPKLRGLKINFQVALLLLKAEVLLVYSSCFCAARQRGTTRHIVLHNSKHKTEFSEKFQH